MLGLDVPCPQVSTVPLGRRTHAAIARFAGTVAIEFHVRVNEWPAVAVKLSTPFCPNAGRLSGSGIAGRESARHALRQCQCEGSGSITGRPHGDGVRTCAQITQTNRTAMQGRNQLHSLLYSTLPFGALIE